MASFLARAMAWRQLQTVDQQPEEDEAEPIINVTGRDYSLQLEVSYDDDEDLQRATVSWRPSTDRPDQVDYYALQWRQHWQDFGANDRQQSINLNDAVGGKHSFRIPDYWAGCRLRLSPQDYDLVIHEAPEVGQRVFQQQMPDWSYDNYQLPDGSIDHEFLWFDIHAKKEYLLTRKIITYHLRNEFGGYCSGHQVQQYLDGQLEVLRNP